MLMSFQVFISILLSIITTVNVVTCYKEFIYKYEEVDFQISDSRNKRSTLFNFTASPSSKKSDLKIRFTSYGRIFHLFLSEDEYFQKVPVEFDFFNTSIENVHPRTKFYEGYLEDDFNSSVICFLSENTLTGRITDSNYTYFIEPTGAVLNHLPKLRNKIIVYRNIDIRQPNRFSHYPKTSLQWEVPYRLPNISLNITVENSGLDIFNQTNNLFCEIELVADHTLYNFYQKNLDKLKAILYYHAKFADFIFRRSDFNMDGSPDGIRIVVGKMSIYKTPEADNYPMVQASSISDYLSLFTSRKQENRYCLSIGILYRRFSGNAVGEAFKPEFRDGNAIGGICDKPLPYYAGGLAGLSFNTGVINLHFQNGKPIPLGITMLAFTHEIGHGFGSAHDPIERGTSLPGKYSTFLMYPSATYESINAMKFSERSREEIKNTLLLKGSCLKDKASKCGNGIREHDEECDCGEERFCSLLDPCCTPSDAKPPEKPCTIRSKKGFECSPKESECCDRNCSVAGSKNMLCDSDIEKCFYSFCDGFSPRCPPLKLEPDLCPLKMICNDTSCSNTSICASLGLEECFCTEYLASQCHQCCLRNVCIPASELGILDSNGNPYILRMGTICNGGQYQCDDSGNCISNILQNETTKELYISMIIIPIFAMILLIFALCVSCRNSSQSNATDNILTNNSS